MRSVHKSGLFGRVGVSVSLGVGWENVGEQADWKLGLGGDWWIGEWIVSLAYRANAVREGSWKNVMVDRLVNK